MVSSRFTRGMHDDGRLRRQCRTQSVRDMVMTPRMPAFPAARRGVQLTRQWVSCLSNLLARCLQIFQATRQRIDQRQSHWRVSAI